MVFTVINVGGELPIEVDLHPPTAGDPAYIGIYPRITWTDEPARSGIAFKNKKTGVRYMVEQHLVSVSALVDDFLVSSPSSISSVDREALAHEFAECAARLRLAVVPEAGEALKQ